MSTQQGFTLLELLIVMAIISILATLAIPTYQSYAVRARFTEVVLATTPYKTAVALALQDGDPLSSINTGESNVPAAPIPTENLASLIVENGVITAQSTLGAGNASYILTPDNTGSHWTISGSCLTQGLCKS